MNDKDHNTYAGEDQALDTESRDVRRLIDTHQQLHRPPKKLGRRVRRLAAQKIQQDITENWLLGKGPWLILVTLILFTVGVLLIG